MVKIRNFGQKAPSQGVWQGSEYTILNSIFNATFDSWNTRFCLRHHYSDFIKHLGQSMDEVKFVEDKILLGPFLNT